MKNMVTDEICHTPSAIILAIALFMSNFLIFRHLFNEDGKGHVEFLEGEILNQTLLKFAPLCSLGIHNLIASQKHRIDNSSSFEYIFKLKALLGYDYI